MAFEIKPITKNHWRLAAIVSGIIVTIIGATVLAGWALNITVLKSILPGMAKMKVNTALGMLFCGPSLVLLLFRDTIRFSRVIVTVLASLVFILAAMTLTEYFLNVNLKIDELFFADTDNTETSRRGRMSPSSVFCFLIAALALWLATREQSALRLPLGSGLGIAMAIIGTLNLLGYISVHGFGFQFWNYSGVGLHTAIAFILLGLGLLALVRSQAGPLWLLGNLMTTGFIISITSLLAIGILSFNLTNQLKETANWIGHTQEALKEIEDVRAGMADLESSQRGYIILGSEQLLGSRAAVRTEVAESLRSLRRLTNDNSLQQNRLDQLQPLIQERQEFADLTIRIRKQEGFEAARSIVQAGKGIALSTKISELLRLMRAEEYRLLALRESKAKEAVTAKFLFLPLGIFLSLSIVLCGVFLLNSGIGERNRAERKVEYQAGLLGQISDAIIATDTESRITTWNHAAMELYGYSEAEVRGRSSAEIIRSELSPKVRQEIWDQIRNYGSYRREFTQYHKDGGTLQVEGSIIALRDSQGKFTGVVSVNRDISQRKAAEEKIQQLNTELEQRVIERTRELQNQTSKLQQLIESSPDAIITLDLTRQLVTSWNKSAETLYGYSAAEAIGKTTDELVTTDRIGVTTESVSQSFAETGRWQGEVMQHNKNGQSLHLLCSAAFVRDAEGNPTGIISINRDISELKEHERQQEELNTILTKNMDQLAIANNELESFSYSVSHDLRAPLRGIDGWSQALLEDYGDQLDAQAHQYLDRVRSETKRMDLLIDAMLDLSRITRAEMRNQQVDLSTLAKTILTRLQRTEPQRKTEFTIQPGMVADCDLALLDIALSNLLGNAFKFTGKTLDSRIEVGQAEIAGERTFFVRDNGAGFDMSFAQKLFGAFQRMHKISDFAGTGVGLATVQRIINRHGGRIWAEAAVNQGATFYFTLAEVS
jgi:PAS domain S-box-containing protein